MEGHTYRWLATLVFLSFRTQSGLSLDRGSERVSRKYKRGMDCTGTGIKNNAAMCLNHPQQNGIMTAKRGRCGCRIMGAVTGETFDFREQQGDGSGWQQWHGRILQNGVT
jgi:hypothetical protein